MDLALAKENGFAVVGKTQMLDDESDININAQGLTDEQYETSTQPERRENLPKELIAEQKEVLA